MMRAVFGCNGLVKSFSRPVISVSSLRSSRFLKQISSNSHQYSTPSTSSERDPPEWDKWFNDDSPKITVPSKMLKRIQKQEVKKQLAAEKERAYQGHGPLVISCKRAEFNHFIGHKYPKGELASKFLASQGWKHRKSVGDWMIIQPFMHLPAFHSTSYDNFDALKVWPKLTAVLKNMSVSNPTYIQECAIPEILSGNNTLIAAETGSGKTLAYLLPMIQSIQRVKSQRLTVPQSNMPLGVILVPSRELVYQIKCICKQLCEPLNMNVDSLSGKDGSKTPKPVDILIATPGALAPMTHHKIFRLNLVQSLVLDEGDTLMDDSFSSTVVDIVNKMNISTELGTGGIGAVQIVIASATMPQGLNNILGDLVDVDAIKTIKTPKLHHVLPHVKQRFERVLPSEKSNVVMKAIEQNCQRSRPTIVFCNGSSAVHHLAYRLKDLQINHCVLTGKLPDAERSGRFESFQKGSSDVLVATDIASRGLDTRRVKHVINFDFPNFVSDYIHRIGRVGRVGSPSKCMVSNYITQRWEVDLLWQLERSIRRATAVGEVNANIKKTLAERNHGHGDLASLFLNDMDLNGYE